jgi:hypothetical protein
LKQMFIQTIPQGMGGWPKPRSPSPPPPSSQRNNKKEKKAMPNTPPIES